MRLRRRCQQLWPDRDRARRDDQRSAREYRRPRPVRRVHRPRPGEAGRKRTPTTPPLLPVVLIRGGAAFFTQVRAEFTVAICSVIREARGQMPAGNCLSSSHDAVDVLLDELPGAAGDDLPLCTPRPGPRCQLYRGSVSRPGRWNRARGRPAAGRPGSRAAGRPAGPADALPRARLRAAYAAWVSSARPNSRAQPVGN